VTESGEPAIDAAIPPGIPATRGGSVVTVGTFDGVHRGHWEVLQQVRRFATAAGRRSVLVTFHPHPLQVLRPGHAPRLLTTPDEKAEVLAESGLDYVVFLPFTPRLAAYPPRRFVEEILLGRLAMGTLIIGYDHGFGRDRSGDVDTLRRIGDELGFEVRVVDAVLRGDDPISSTRIRRALTAGDVAAAAAALGRPYSLRGPVVRGAGLGRGLGFPTANIHVPDPDKLLPRDGIYAVTAILRGRRMDGVLHLGPRPTYPGLAPSVEVHLFEWDDELYGEEVRIDFCARIRDIARFDGDAALAEAIAADCARARALLAAGAGACKRAGEALP
jgi:riboflavin kinase / FMN adenylyltransferase